MILKLLRKGTILHYSFDGKHDDEIGEPVWPNVIEIGPRSVQKGGPGPPKDGPSSIISKDSNSVTSKNP